MIQISCIGYGQCFTENFAFKEGETITYDAVYQWGFIWITAGRVVFTVKTDTFNNREVYHFDTYGETLKKFDLFFKVRDRYQSYLDKKTFKPLWYHRTSSEGGYNVDNEFFFNQENNMAVTYVQNSNRPLTVDTVKLPYCTFDVVSLAYYSRNIDFTKYKINDKIPVTVILDNEIFELYIRYRGKEILKTRDGTKYRCLVFSAMLVEGTMFKGGEDMRVWVTDDKNRIPVLVEAKVLVGSVKGVLTDMKDLKNPVDALIKEDK